jgi:hypothetical protein
MTATRGDPLDQVSAARSLIAGVDPDLPVLEPASLYEAIDADKRVLDAMAALFFAFAGWARCFWRWSACSPCCRSRLRLGPASSASGWRSARRRPT